MFKVFLVIYNITFSSNTMVVSVDDGYSSREQPNWKICTKRKDKFNKTPSLDGKVRFASCRKYWKDG